MTFVTASLAVAGVLAIVIPIAIHLLWRQRRTPVPWAAMRFLLEAYRRHRRRLQLEQILLLAVRCLLLAVLGFALARPLLEAAGMIDTGGQRVVYLVVDDGLVSGARTDDDETALARHVARGIEIIEALDAGDRVGLVTAARPARNVLTPPSTDHAAVIELLESLAPADAPTDLPGAFDRLRVALEAIGPDLEQAWVYLLSDLRAGSVALEERLAPSLHDLGPTVRLVAESPATASVPNVQITSIVAARALVLPGMADGSGQVSVRLARHGGALDRAVTTVRLAGDGVTRTEPKLVTWAPGQSEANADFLLDFAAQGEGERGITATIDDDALPADNDRHAVLALRRELRTVLIDRRSFGFEPTLDRLTAGQWIRRALEPAEASPIEVVTVEPAALDEADLLTTDVAILPRPDLLPERGWALLRRFVDRGGILMLSPPADLRVHEWIDRAQDALDLPWRPRREIVDYAPGAVLAGEQPASALLRMISADLDELARPVVVSRALPLEGGAGDADVILAFADGTPLAVAGAPRPSGTGAGDGVADDPSTPTAAGAPPSRGFVVYLAVAPELTWTNLPGKPLMVPFYHETIRQGLGLVRSARPVGAGDRAALAVGPAATALVAPDGARVDLGADRRPERALARHGLYRVVDAAAQTVGAVAVNVSAPAARTDPQPATAVESWLEVAGPWRFEDGGDLTVALGGDAGGSPLAGLLLLAFLALLLLETALARWFSHAPSRGPSGEGHGLMPSMHDRVTVPTGGVIP